METLLAQVEGSPLAIIVLVTWVLSLRQERAKLQEQLFSCIDTMRGRVEGL